MAVRLAVPSRSWLGAPYRRTDGHYYHLELIRAYNPTCVKHAPALSTGFPFVGFCFFSPNFPISHFKQICAPERDFFFLIPLFTF